MLKGHYTGVLRHKDGSEEVYEKDNLILDIGYDFLRHAIFSSRQLLYTDWARTLPHPMAWIAVGSGGEGEGESTDKTAYGLKKFRAARNAVVKFDENDVRKVKLITTFQTHEANGDLSEAGVCNFMQNHIVDKPTDKPDDFSYFNHGQNTYKPIFLDRVTFPKITKTAEDFYTCTFEFTFGDLKDE